MIACARNTLVGMLVTTALLAGPAGAQEEQRGAEQPPDLAIDGGSERAFERTLDLMRRSLSSPDRGRLDLVVEYARSTFPTSADLREAFHGRTAPDLLGMADLLHDKFDENRDGRLDQRELDEMRSDLARARIEGNEAAAVAGLLGIVAAQTKARADLLIDVNRDELGEYAFLGELAGTAGLRDGSGTPGRRRARPPLLADGWAVEGRRAVRYGYVFQLWLPSENRLAIAEGERGGVGEREPDPAQASKTWVAYAWPLERDATGRRAFCVTQDGVVFETDNRLQRYDGHQRCPQPYAAFAKGTGVLGPLPAKALARNDGGAWKPVE